MHAALARLVASAFPPPHPPLSMVLRLPCTSQSAARLVKETMDKKYNESWVVVIGQGFAFEVTHEVKHVLWMFLSDLSALVYKGAALRRVTRPLPTPRPSPPMVLAVPPTTTYAAAPTYAASPHRGSWREASRRVSEVAAWARYVVGGAAVVHIVHDWCTGTCAARAVLCLTCVWPHIYSL